MPEQFLHGIEVVEIDNGSRPIQTVRSSVIGLVGTAPKGPVNTPTLIAGSRTEAVNIFGAGIGTIPDALDAIFDQAGAMVVVINVLDPATHKTAVAPVAYSFDTVTETLEVAHDYILNPVVKNTGDTVTYVLNTDYTFDSDTGVFTRITTGAIGSGESVNIGYDRPDASLVTTADVQGGVDAGTGAYSGVHALLAAESTLGVVPKLLVAAGYTSDRPGSLANPVVSDMLGIADSLRAIIIADGTNTNDADALTYRGDWGSRRVYVVDPAVEVWDTATNSSISQPASARVAGMIAKSDNERGFWWSPSNREMYGIVGTTRAVDFALDDPNARANYLNENEVATIIRKEGYRLWGNRTTSSDPKWAFLSVVRTADMINESLLKAHLWAVDRNITKTYLEDVTEGVNAYLRSLTAQGAILGGKCWADPELNTPANISAGKVYFDFDFSPNYPAEHITFRSHLVNDYIEEII
ncbi:MAG: phage tail sheath subtilisin-like domain-containing protein [Gammaproteobacteria bacterium]|nr:phage tail sheath subtilisin-like domain-containing protein [Gammaproteobacteria bacterium]MDH5651694.1 phage tail sheath subtilisin-like domain-containing protein [Gammaproteobacteria bacterium]